jgi:hypothetical protein
LAEVTDDFDDTVRRRNVVAHGLEYDENKLPTGRTWKILATVMRRYMQQHASDLLAESDGK